MKIDKIPELREKIKTSQLRKKIHDDADFKDREMQTFEDDIPLDRVELYDEYFSSSIISEIEPAALTFAQEHIVDNVYLYRLLKAIVSMI